MGTSQLRNHLQQTGLEACLWGISLVDCKRSQPTVGSTTHWVDDPGLCEKNSRASRSAESLHAPASAPSQVSALISLKDGH